MNVRISLVATANDRTLTWGTAHDPDAAGRLALAYLSVGSCRAGRTKVVMSVTPDPDPLPCSGDGVLDTVVDGMHTAAACPGCANCRGGGR